MKTFKRLISRLRSIVIKVVKIVVILQVLLYLLSHHEYDFSFNVKRVYIETDELQIEYTKPDDIKRILRKIRGLNFYRPIGEPSFVETPTERIIISYKDAQEKEIVVRGDIQVIKGIYGTDTYSVSEYTYSLHEWTRFFNTLPKEKELAHYIS